MSSYILFIFLKASLVYLTLFIRVGKNEPRYISEYSAKKFIFSMVSEKVSPYFSLQFSLFLEENFEDLHFELWIDCQEFPGHIEKNLLFLESKLSNLALCSG